jgi:hypothetical protein
MPRLNHPRRRGFHGDDEKPDLARSIKGRSTIEQKSGGKWHVQPIAAASATKTYTCPSCGLEIAPGTAHVVTWRADGLLGDEDAIAARRHWHTHCWAISR